MEIESRYLVPGASEFRKIQSMTILGHYHLLLRTRKRIHDTYLDTADRRLTHAGWACRIRKLATGEQLVTVKGPADTGETFNVRDEWEFSVNDAPNLTQNWSDTEPARIVDRLAKGQELLPMVELDQRRRYALLLDGIRRVGQVTFDRVTIRTPRLLNRVHFVECELLPDGDKDDLYAFDNLLTGQYHVTAHPVSKLQRALDLMAAVDLFDEPETAVRLSVEETARQLCVDFALAESISRMMRQLYDQLQPLHALPPWHRALCDTASLLYCAGESLDYKKPWQAAHRIATQLQFTTLSKSDRTMLPGIVMLAGAKLSARNVRRAFPNDVTEQNRLSATIIAALLRIAYPLTRYGDELPSIKRVKHTRDSRPIEISLSGPDAIEAVRQASKCSDLWEQVTGCKLHWRVSREATSQQSGITPKDTFPATASKILEYHQQAVTANEDGTRAGTDPEALHDMRVATRRLRSFLQLFGGLLPNQQAAAAAALRVTARSLGNVRDLDVALANLHLYAVQQTDAEALALNPLIDNLQDKRTRAREQLINHLGSPDYEQTLGSLEELIQATTTAAQIEGPAAIKVIAPFIHVRYGTLLSYAPVVDNAPVALLHTLRIDCKRLRYALEFYQEVIPARVTTVIPRLVSIQDHLGELHDAEAAVFTIDTFLQEKQITPQNKAETWQACNTYRKVCLDLVAQRLETFPNLWKQIDRGSVKEAFDRLLRKAR